MSNFIQIIKACESAHGAGSKQTIINALKTADETAKMLLKEALDPYRVFGVKQYVMPAGYRVKNDVMAFDHLLHTLDALAGRAYTGDAARIEVTMALRNFTADAAPYIARIIDKDLAAGFSADTVNKVFPGLIPSFKVMLADKCETPEEFESKITFPCLAEEKLDGERTIAVVKADSVTYYSRSGKEATHCQGLFDDELLRLRAAYGGDCVLDGERYASNFTETMNAKKSGNDDAKAALKYHVFFIMPLTHWIAQQTSNSMNDARNTLQQLLSSTNIHGARFTKVTATKGRGVTSYQDMMAYCNEAIDQHGVEGLILKDRNSTYVWDRDLAWCKVKRFYDVDCRLMAVYPGRPKSRLEHTLGGIKVRGQLESGEWIEADVGSGFSDAQRNDIWSNQAVWIGRTVVIKYQEVTHGKGKTIASLRFPTFERDRDDKTVEVE
jgi:DNA ligase-1